MPPDPDNSVSIFIDNSRAKSATVTKAESRRRRGHRPADRRDGPPFFGTHSMTMMMMAGRDLAPVRAVTGYVDLKIKSPFREKRLLRILIHSFTTRRRTDARDSLTSLPGRGSALLTPTMRLREDRVDYAPDATCPDSEIFFKNDE